MTAGALLKVAFIGAGRLAHTLARDLVHAGYPVVAVASRTAASADRLTARLPGSRTTTPQHAADMADLVFVTTSDSAIETACVAVTWRPGQTAVHCSGAATAGLLAKAKRDGAAVAAFHPITTFASFDDPTPALSGVTFGADGDPAALALLSDVAERLGGKLVPVAPELKALYHAGGVIACNYLVTLLGAGERLMTMAGLPPEDAGDALRLMMRRTLDNTERLGTAPALSGPVSRGDAGTVERHLAALEGHAPDLVELYRVMGAATIPFGSAKGTLSAEDAAELVRLLQPHSTPTGG